MVLSRYSANHVGKVRNTPEGAELTDDISVHLAGQELENLRRAGRRRHKEDGGWERGVRGGSDTAGFLFFHRSGIRWPLRAGIGIDTDDGRDDNPWDRDSAFRGTRKMPTT